MRLGSLIYLVAGLFLVSACETMQESGKGSASGSKQAVKSKKPGKTAPSSFSIKPGTGRDFVVNIGDRVFFDLNKSNLSSGARAKLQKQVAWLKNYRNITVQVEGHCDERGTREYNLGLGERRANSVKDFMIAMGINPNRIKVISYGKERPAALGHNEGSWKQNRRAVTVVAGG